VTFYPTTNEAIAAHARLIARFGGSPGLRDRGALEAALSRPQTGYYVDLIQEAAALWESLSQNHPFVDGNKRVAITVAAAFLKIKAADENQLQASNSAMNAGRVDCREPR
jgi:death on curing protein